MRRTLATVVLLLFFGDPVAHPAAAQVGGMNGRPGFTGSWPPCPPPYNVWAGGALTINCSALDVQQQVCQTEEASIEFLGRIVNWETGQSSSECVTVTIPPGTKVWWEYEFRIFYLQSIFNGVCKATNEGPTGNKRFQSAPATPADCGSKM